MFDQGLQSVSTHGRESIRINNSYLQSYLSDLQRAVNHPPVLHFPVILIENHDYELGNKNYLEKLLLNWKYRYQLGYMIIYSETLVFTLKDHY